MVASLSREVSCGEREYQLASHARVFEEDARVITKTKSELMWLVLRSKGIVRMREPPSCWFSSRL